MTNKLNNNSLKLLISNFLFRGARIVFGLFLNIFLWKETNDIQLIALFNILFLLSHGVGFILLSGLVKNGFRRVINLISFIGFILSYFLIIFVGENIINYILIIGIIFGFFNGTYYIGYNVIQFELTSFKNRGNFEGLKKALRIGTKTIFPAIFGIIIGLYNIELALILGVIMFIIGFFVGDIKHESIKGKMKIKKFMKIALSNSKILYSIIACFFFTLALSIPLLEIIIPILIYNDLGSEIKLGFSFSLLSLLSIVIIYLFGKFIDYRHYNKSLILLTFIYILCLLFIIFVKDIAFLLIISSIIISVISLYGVGISTITYNSLHSIKNYKEYNVEFNTFKESAFILGWIISFLIIYFSGNLSDKSIGILFFIMILLSVISTIFLIKIKMHEIEK